MRITLALALALTIATATAAHAELQLPLNSLNDWEQAETGEWMNAADARMSSTDAKLLETDEGAGVLVNGTTGKTVNLFTHMDFKNWTEMTVSLEFMVPEGSNSGVYLMGRYEVQILDSWGEENPEYSDCGGIYQSDAKEEGRKFDGVPPRVNASKKPGEWQSYVIKFRAPKFDEDGNKIANAMFVEVKHNGVVIHENVEVPSPTRSAAFLDEKPEGPLMLQGDHGPVAYRNITVNSRIW